MLTQVRRAAPVAAVSCAIALSSVLSGCGDKTGSDVDTADATDAADALVVYTSRNEQLVKPLFDRYTEETGQSIQYVTGKAAPLMQRLAAEGTTTPADLFFTVDAGNLWKAASDGLLRPVESATLSSNIPEHLRDPDNQWVGLSVRARTIAYSTERVEPNRLSTYEQLADPAWRGKLCLRTSKKVYNQSLVAMLIAAYGEPRTEQIVRGWVTNLAAEPFANDTAVLEAIEAGQCDVGIVNSYYFGRLEKDDPAIPVKLFWPNQNNGSSAAQGVHVNISGAGITKHADQAAAAQAFLEWMSQPEAQAILAGDNLEYPASSDVDAVQQVRAWGEFDQNIINVAQAGALQADAVRLMERAGYR